MPVTQTHDAAIMPPLKIAGLLQAHWANSVLRSALELDVFSPLKGRGASADEVAKQRKLDSRATKLLLDALVAMEFVVRNGDRYALTDIADTYLVPQSDLYMASYIIGRRDMHAPWEQLTDTIKTGKPFQRVNEPAEAAKFFPELARLIFPLNFATAQNLASTLNIKSLTQPFQVLDLAAGTGVWSLPMALMNKNVHVDALDFPSVLEVTKEFATKYGVANQYGFLAGAWQDVKITEAHYDLIILGHILHSEGKDLSEKLLAACARSLKPGGRLVVAEFFDSDEGKPSPLFPSLFAINMLVATAAGCVFSPTQLSSMIQDAGLRDSQRLELPGYGEQSPIMVAHK